jgi:hypothetical protein
MVPLLEELWKEGIRTTGSCEEWLPGLARIWFHRGEDKMKFIREHPGAFDSGSGAVDFPTMYLVAGERHPESSGGLK